MARQFRPENLADIFFYVSSNFLYLLEPGLYKAAHPSFLNHKMFKQKNTTIECLA